MTDVFDYDAELRCYNARLREAAEISADDLVLDIGCGAGQTTREAGRAARSGSALGVDLSASMLDRARKLSESEGVANVSFVQADAQVHVFSAEHFTVGISRFATMFFADPIAAFTNIGSALRPGARLVQVVWQAPKYQEWVSAIRHALAGGPRVPDGPAGAAFSLADPGVATRVLTAAGFTAIEITGMREPVYYGPDAASAYDAVIGLGMAKDLVADLDAAGTTNALERLMCMLKAHETSEGVRFESGAWLISGQRR